MNPHREAPPTPPATVRTPLLARVQPYTYDLVRFVAMPLICAAVAFLAGLRVTHAAAIGLAFLGAMLFIWLVRKSTVVM